MGGSNTNDYSNNSNSNRHNDAASNNDDGWKRARSLPVELLRPGDGDTPAQKAVCRIRVADLLLIRMSYLAPPLSWQSEGGTLPGPPDACRWTAENRAAEIHAMAKAERQSGDVSQSRRDSRKGKGQKIDTAPPIEDCKPLEVNDETRWKSRVFDTSNTDKDLDSDDVVKKKALL